jgi:hypothetical protein
MCYTNEFHQFQFLFALVIINVKIIFNFEKEWCTFDKEKSCLKKIKLSILKDWMFWTCKRTFDLHQILSIVNMSINVDIVKISSGYERLQMSFGMMEETWIHLFNCWLFNLINLGDCFYFKLKLRYYFPLLVYLI